MLFARFLDGNDLLIEPELNVPVSLEDCEELGRQKGLDKWAMAAHFAHEMLPQVFRPAHPVSEVRLAREHRLKLEGLIESLPADVFLAGDALGWVYQFWQSRKKDEVNRSGSKIGADELPAVTQLFTEPYMVNFLLDNSLGAWWAARRLSASDLNDADSEAELRRRAAIPGTPLEYLRFVKREDTAEQTGWRPAAGTFEGWPDSLSKLRLLDPCCGSGHFLVAAFLMLVPMRMTLEGLNADEAIDAVLRENLHGLELDPRCVALAAFALALEAWRYPGTGGYRPLPRLNLAWCGQPVGGTREQWAALATGDSRLEAGMDALYGAFRHAPILGSLIDPARSVSEDMFTADFGALESLLGNVLSDDTDDDEWRERATAARGLATAARLLTVRYHAVITNVPYLGREKHAPQLRRFLDEFHPLSKYDVATAFIERISALCGADGYAFLVLPQYWLFLSRYAKLRKCLLEQRQWRFLVTLGPGAFDAISGEVVNTCLAGIGPSRKNNANDSFTWLDISKCRAVDQKAHAIQNTRPVLLTQASQMQNPDSIIGYRADERCGLLQDVAYSYQGLATSDNPQFVFNFWELDRVGRGWVFFQFAPDATNEMSGCSHVLFWENGNGKYAEHAGHLKKEGRLGGWKSGHAAWGKRGVAINRMGQLPAALYFGTKFDCNVAVIIPHDERDIPAIWAYCSSQEYGREVRRLNGKLSVTNSTLAKVPYEGSRWAAVAKNGTTPFAEVGTSDPRQWAFHGHPAHADDALQVAAARLLGYRWPAERDPDMELSREQRVRVEKIKAVRSFEDDDGIVCIPAVRGERSASDRLLNLLTAAFGDAWNDNVLAKLLAGAGSPTLDDWLRNRFFDQHCKLFHHRPFVWHVWDGRRHDGFHALVNYHKLVLGDGKGCRLLESLAYSYLGDWINRQQDGSKRGERGAEDRMVAALRLQRRLVAILEGEPPFDLFVRWKPIEEQPIGWNPDINDGVRLNIRPFLAEDIPGGRKGAGILRVKPNIHWRNDRGKEPLRDEGHFPWFWKNGEFVPKRVNDVHLTRTEKNNRQRIANADPSTESESKNVN